MAALRVPFDDVDRCAGAAEPAVRIRVPGLGGRRGMPCDGCRRYLLLLQPPLPRPRAPRAAWPPTDPLPRHGPGHSW